MKSPSDLARKLVGQWNNADLREARLTQPDAWPVRLSIGRPPPALVERDLDSVRAHIRAWNGVEAGNVEWQEIAYRSVSDAIRLPLQWTLNQPSEWVAATGSAEVCSEYTILNTLCTETSRTDHTTWIRRRHLWRNKDTAEIIRASRLADQLVPDCAEGRPLRALAYEGIDSKFYERNRVLLTHLLDARFDGAASDLGLEVFLGAAPENDHWLLVADLADGQLPFTQQRVRASELAGPVTMPGSHIIIVENERCLHQLPQAPGLIAILGAGLNLSWLSAPWLQSKQIAYWGDLDTWGLRMLAMARRHLPKLQALLMDPVTYDTFAAQRSVKEPLPAPGYDPGTLSAEEQHLFQRLATAEKGRFEQEFIPEKTVQEAVRTWMKG